MWGLVIRMARSVTRYNTNANSAPRMGHATHVPKILVSTARSVCVLLNRFHPRMPPTMACVVETGSPAIVMP
jgi:hypothetical protein